MPTLRDELKNYPGGDIQALVGYPAEPYEPRWSSSQFDALQDMLFMAVLFEPNRLQIDGPLIPVHAVINRQFINEVTHSGSAKIIEEKIKALQGINPKVIIEYVTAAEVRANFESQVKE